MKKKILVMDSEVSVREFFKAFFRKLSGAREHLHDPVFVENPQKALERFKTQSYHLAILDLRASTSSEILQQLRYESRGTPLLLLLSADGNEETAQKCVEQAMVDDYIAKPFNIEVLERKVLTLLKKPVLQKRGSGALSSDRVLPPIGQSSAMKNILSDCKKISSSLSTVLITGESGTGKEVLARYIHQLSTRRRKPFVEVNCGAIPRELMDSELFGHIKGSFTGANSDRLGFFELASEGTLFLDEIGELPLSLQPRLLRALQEKRIRPVGSGQHKDVDIRLIAATNRNLEHMVSENSFREDLFFRLHVIHITIPPLRERREDIADLARHFIKKYVSGKKSKVEKYLTPKLMEALQSYDYPGNVRELENIIERVVVLGETHLLFPKPGDQKNGYAFRSPVLSDSGLDLEKFVEDMEKDLIMQALEKTGGEQKSAARMLKLSPRSLRYRLQKYKLAG